MAFVVEDGTGVSDANSYTDVAFADEYFNDRGIAEWDGSNEEKQAALILATDYVELRFGRRWIGEMANPLQGLSWPRVAEGIPEDEVPVKLQRAVCEYAKRALTAQLAPDPEVSAAGASVVTVREKVGPLEEQFQVLGHGSVKLFRPYPTADSLLQGLVLPADSWTYR